MILRYCLLVGLVVFGSCRFAVAEPVALSEELLREGWISLFDGESMYGWTQSGEAQWEVENGEIRTSGTAEGFLMTTTAWADFALEVEYKAPAGTNSGVFLRTTMKPTDPAADCYELNIAPPDNPFPTGSLVARQKTRLRSDDKLADGECIG